MLKLDFTTTVLHLVQGASFLLVVVYLIGLLRPFLSSNRVLHDTVVGLMYGAATVIGMSLAIPLNDGIIFDARSVILGVGSAFGGPMVGLVSGICAILFRVYVGGSGIYVGSAVIALSVTIGCGFYLLSKADKLERRFFEFLLFGFLLHLATVLCFSFIPGMTLRETMNVIGFPVLVAFTPTTAVLCLMVWSQMSRDALTEQSRQDADYVRSLYDQSPIAQISASAKDGGVLAFNDALSRLTGYSPDELRGMKVFELYADTPSGVEKAKAVFKRFQNGERIDGEQLELRRKDGGQRYISLLVNPVLNELGGVKESRSALIDVTSRVEAEAALEASRSRLGCMLDQLHDPVVIYDKELRIQYANTAFLDLTDRTLESLVGRLDKETWPPNVYTQYLGKLEETFQTGQINVLTLQQVFKVDDHRDLLAIMHPIVDVGGRVVEVMMLFDDQTDMLRAEGERIQLEIERKTLEKDLYKALLDTIGAISMTVEKRDPYTAGHQNRVAMLSVAIAQKLGWNDHRIEGLRLGAMIHDMGKIYVPAEILNRPGKLTADEFNIIKTHPAVGEEIISAINFPWPVAKMVSQHHERIDGTGYPHGLRGQEIVDEAKIIAVADVVEAITSHRPYRPAIGIEEGLSEIERGRGTSYDPEIVDACLAVVRDEGFKFV